MGELIGTATVDSKGLMSSYHVRSLTTSSLMRGLSGGSTTTWFKIATFRSEAYAPILFDGALGTFQEESMSYFKFRITYYNNKLKYSKESIPSDVFGYTIDGNNSAIYLKLTATRSVIMQMRGGSIISLSDESTTTEPDGITYLE